MNDYITRGLVLHKRRLREADRLYIIFTENLGKVYAKARSAARSRSKLAGHLEPPILTTVHLIKGREFYILAGSRTIERYLQVDFKKQQLMTAVNEFLLKVIPQEVPEEELFNLSLEYFRCLESLSLSQARAATSRFIWQALNILGFMPEKINNLNITTNLSQEVRDIITGYAKRDGLNLTARTDHLNQADFYTHRVLQELFDQEFKCLTFAYEQKL